MLTKLTKKDFDSILENYDIGIHKSHKYIFTGGNTVFKIKTTKGTYILKVYQKASMAFVRDQIKIMEFLNNTKVSTPKIINTKKGDGLLIWNKSRITIQEFAQGKSVEFANMKLAKDMGKKFGILDRTLLKFKTRIKSEWDDAPNKIVKWKIKSLANTNLVDESKKLVQDVSQINLKKLKKGLIHGDLCEANFLVKNDKVTAIIDWDDTRVDYLVYEVAIPIAHLFIRDNHVEKEQIKAFMKEYQKELKFNNEEKKALYFFVKHRELSASAWCVIQTKRHPNKKTGIMKWATGGIRKYNTFSKMSLEEFLELVK